MWCPFSFPVIAELLHFALEATADCFGVDTLSMLANKIETH